MVAPASRRSMMVSLVRARARARARVMVRVLVRVRVRVGLPDVLPPCAEELE